MIKTQIAIIGAGAIARAHIEAYLKLNTRCEIVAICDLFVDKAEALIKEYALSAQAFTSLEEALKVKELDAVSICLPPDSHCPVAVLALNAGCHVLCEKPMATSLQECDEMIKAAKENNRYLSVVCQNRYKTPMNKVHKLIKDEVAGKVLFANVESLWWRGEHYHDIWWRGTWEKECGGVMTSHAVHHLDLLQWMIGMPDKITAVMTNVGHDNSQTEDVGIAILQYKDKIAQLTASMVSHGEEQKFCFQCEKGRVNIPWDPACNKALPNAFPTDDVEGLEKLKNAYKNLPELEIENHEGQINNFINAIEGKEELLIDGEEGRKTIMLIMAIYAACATGETINLPLCEDSPFYCKESMNKRMPHFHEKYRNIDNFATSTITFGRDVGK